MQKTSEFLELYISRGLTPIPLERGEKTPILRDWPNVSREEALKAFEYLEDYNVGIRIEPPFFVLDVDDRRLAPLILDEISQTWIVETRRGCHVYLKAPEGHYPHTNKKSKLIQLLAEGCQAVAPPSIVEGHRYHFAMNSFEAGIVEVDEKVVKRIEKIIDALGEGESLILKFSEIWDEGHRHNLSLWLNGALRKSGIERFEAAVILKSVCLLAGDPELKDRLTALKTSYERPIEEIGAWSYLKRELESIVGPERASEILKLFPAKVYEEVKREAAEKPRVKYVVGGETVEGHIFELVDDAGTLKLLVYDPLTCGLQVSESLKMNSFVFKPYPELPFKEYLPGVPGAINEDPSLWRETLEFIREYYDNPRSDDVYHLMVSVTVWSYFCDIVKGSTPYLCFLGTFRTGKTRGLELMAALCYKPMLVVDPSEASMFRIIEEFKPTLIVDEAQVLEKNIRAIMASGYRYGMKVPRVIDPETDGLEGIRWFDCFGLKVYACREEPPDDILSRSIVIHCEKNIRQVRRKIDLQRARELRTRWLAQRLRMLNKIAVTFEEFQSEDGRLQELISPLIVMASVFGGQEAVAAIERYGRRIESEIQAMEASTEEAEIIEALQAMVAENQQDAPSVVLVRELTARLNQEYQTPMWTPEKVGRRLSALGFQRVKLSGGRRGYKVDHQLLERLIKRYGLDVAAVSSPQLLPKPPYCPNPEISGN